MSLPVPNLDDRAFADLVRDARERIARTCPEWTDLSVHDPGITLVEAFAHLTEVLLYRLNRVPEKTYVEFLNLLGVARRPPAAAWAGLVFGRAGEDRPRVAIPAGTAVAGTGGADPRPVVFVTTESAELAAGAAEVAVRGYHCDVVAGELLGPGTGRAGQILRTAHAPLVTTTEAYDVVLGVEVPPGTTGEVAAGRDFGGRTFEIWAAVSGFAGVAPDAKVYQLDRSTGTVTFAPAVDGGGVPVAAVPAAGREVRLWYRTGGGPAGNVAPGTLTALRTPIPGVTVTNPQAAVGGRALEPIESALTRGPYEFFALRRAVTARDFELLATAASPAVARATAFTRSAMWAFAHPGEVEVVLVPHVGAESRPGGRLPMAALLALQTEDVRAQTQADLDTRRALGTRVLAGWARYKPVSVRARVVVGPHEDPDAVRRRINDRLYGTISPLPTPLNPTGWAFGEPLRASNVYRLLEQAEPGVRYVDDVRFVLDEAPDQVVRTVAADQYQADTWYAGAGELLFRSTNGGDGWEPVGRFPGEDVRIVTVAPAAARPGIVARPGHLAAVSRDQDGGSVVRISSDLGETWTLVAALEPAVADVAWIDREGAAALLLATDAGLYAVAAQAGAVPLQILVDQADPDKGFSGVRAFVSDRGVHGVAVAAQAQQGVYLSVLGGAAGSFSPVGLRNVDVRTLEVQLDGPATVLWAGAGEPDASRPGQGCQRARLFEASVQWEKMNAGWTGGTCWDIAFDGPVAVAATQSGGVLRLDSGAPGPQWQPANVNSGLPLRDRTRFMAVTSLAVSGPGTHRGRVLAGTAGGAYRTDDGAAWAQTAGREVRQAVTIPATWLLCSAEHAIDVVRADAQR
ncbi:putative baseplate assembly protein [Dactylosporangium vinaceum]|uniref:Baseplate assembly protein n=1 Tax=Dactylosporangium vinaceum TaxID=53362 RepID=A0ABV5LZ85_9ACTN|nr:putative baseplate assembly protein [Dactylosporangium vinaceum]UAB92558.1 putative baseplate assembly protein [Dactylosporangium vinaceum]